MTKSHQLARPWPAPEQRPRHLASWLLMAVFLMLAGCLDSVPTGTNPETAGSTARTYTGPAPATADVQAFKNNVWENLRATNRCGACHGSGGQSPQFVRDDDVNAAYGQAITVADLGSPADSRLVSKVAGGHNCWLDSDSACGAVMTAYIEAWAGNSVTGGSNQIELVAPTIKDPGDTKNFPDDLNELGLDGNAFSVAYTTLHNLLTTHCAECHTESSATPQAPFFATSDIDASYDSIKSSQKINLDDVDQSRLVVRLGQEFHNCWSGDCAADALAMQNAIEAFTDQIAVTQVDAALVVSKALNLTDGLIASSGARHEANVIALYEFKTGSGDTAYDTSGIEPAINLNLAGTEGVDFKWVGGWGIEFINSKAQGATADSAKLHDFITSSGEYSIEAWVVPANVTQEGPARIISYSAGTTARNFTLGQTLYNYDFLHRSTTTDGNGEPALSTADADEDLQATQQHVVVTFDPVNGRRIYVNGVFTDDLDPEAAGNLGDWDDTFALVLGNDVSSDRQWQGKLRMVAIHDRVLSQAQITQNFEAGVGETFYLLFNISDLINVPQSYIVFQVSQFDSYAYLFNEPMYVTLDDTADPNNIPIQGVRVGVNGKEPSVGQAFRNLDTTIDSSQLADDRRFTTPVQILSDIGTIIALEKGVDNDEFFLTFEVLGSHTNVVTEPAPLQPAAVGGVISDSDIGLRTFEEIHATMSAITGVSMTETNVAATYSNIKQQLPTVENIETFLSSHQVAISQLAVEYCNALVEDSSLRTAFFGNFGFTDNVTTAFALQTDKEQITTALHDKIIGTTLNNAPTQAQIDWELIDPANNGPVTYNLYDRLTASCPTGCDAQRTRTIVKSMCAAVLSSGAVLIQ